MKKVKKLMFLIFCICCVMIIGCTSCDAAGLGGEKDGKRTWSGYTDIKYKTDANGKVELDENGNPKVDEAGSSYNFATKFLDDAGDDAGIKNSVQKILGTVIKVIRIVGTGMSIIMLTYIAIKYMSAAPNEKAEFKKSATAFIVGAIVLFATTNILGIIVNFATSNIKVVK